MVSLFKKFTLKLALVGILSLSNHAQAFDLMQAWEMSLSHDPQMAVARASKMGGEAYKEQADALWRPTVLVNTVTGVSSSKSLLNGAEFSAPAFGRSTGVEFGTSMGNGSMNRWILSAKQSIYDVEKRAQGEQLNFAFKASALNATLMEQQLALSTFERYANVLKAQTLYALIKNQLQAVTASWREAKDRFELGDAPVTDVYEANARAKSLQAQLNGVENELQLSKLVLANAMGISANDVLVKELKVSTRRLALAPLSQTLLDVQTNNISLEIRSLEVANAQLESQKYTQTISPVLDAVASVSKDQLQGSGDFGSAKSVQSQQMFGFNLSIPLYTGGARGGKLKETLALSDKSKAEYDMRRDQLLQLTHSVWSDLNTASDRLSAFDEALFASQARLDATRIGRQVGDKTTLELLNAENDMSQAQLAALQAKLDFLNNRLKIDVLTNQFSMHSMKKINDDFN